MLFTRFRSKSRNLQTDEARFRPVSSAVVSAIDECARELAGLRRRMEAVRKTAAFLMDTDQDGCAHHDSQIACTIHQAEGSLLEAELRASTLGSQIVILHKLSVRRRWPDRCGGSRRATGGEFYEFWRSRSWQRYLTTRAMRFGGPR